MNNEPHAAGAYYILLKACRKAADLLSDQYDAILSFIFNVLVLRTETGILKFQTTQLDTGMLETML